MTITYDNSSLWKTVVQVRGSVVSRIWGILTGTVIITVLAVIISKSFTEPSFVDGLKDESTLAFVLTPVAFLLIFRTNQAYTQYWEGRETVVRINLHSFTLLRICVGYVGDDSVTGKILRSTLARLVQLLADACYQALEKSLANIQSQHVTESEREVFEVAAHPVELVMVWISRVLSTGYHTGWLDIDVFQRAEKHLYDVLAAYTTGDKIRTTPFPFPYIQIMHSGLIILTVFLPFGFAYTYSWAAIPLCFIIALAFGGMNSAAVEIQDPFGVDHNDFDLSYNRKFIFSVAKALQSLCMNTTVDQSEEHNNNKHNPINDSNNNNKPLKPRTSVYSNTHATTTHAPHTVHIAHTKSKHYPKEVLPTSSSTSQGCSNTSSTFSQEAGKIGIYHNLHHGPPPHTDDCIGRTASSSSLSSDLPHWLHPHSDTESEDGVQLGHSLSISSRSKKAGMGRKGSGSPSAVSGGSKTSVLTRFKNIFNVCAYCSKHTKKKKKRTKSFTEHNHKGLPWNEVCELLIRHAKVPSHVLPPGAFQVQQGDIQAVAKPQHASSHNNGTTHTHMHYVPCTEVYNPTTAVHSPYTPYYTTTEAASVMLTEPVEATTWQQTIEPPPTYAQSESSLSTPVNSRSVTPAHVPAALCSANLRGGSHPYTMPNEFPPTEFTMPNEFPPPVALESVPIAVETRPP